MHQPELDRAVASDAAPRPEMSPGGTAERDSPVPSERAGDRRSRFARRRADTDRIDGGLDGFAGRLDEDLAAAAAAGARPAFVELYRRHQDLAWGLARALTLDDAVAANVVVDAFIQTIESLSPPDARASAAGSHTSTARRRAHPADDATFRCLLATAVHSAASERSEPPAAGRGVEGSATTPAIDVARIELHDALAGPRVEEFDVEAALRMLPTVVPPPPPELWALVEVAWEDRIVR